MGNCLGYLCGPFLASKAEDVPILLYFDAFLAMIPFVCALCYFPNSPKLVPSKAAVDALNSVPFHHGSNCQNHGNAKIQSVDPLLTDDALNVTDLRNSNRHNSDHRNLQHFSSENGPNRNLIAQNLYHFWNETKRIVTSKDTILMVTVGGFQFGISSAYNGVTQDMLHPLGFSDVSIGIIGFIQTGLNMVGALIVSAVVDRYFSRKLKAVLIGMFALCVMVLSVLLFIVPSPWNHNGFGVSIEVVAALMGTLGLLSGGLVPLFYELTAEVSIPNGISEGTSSTFLVLMINATSLVFIGIANWIGTQYETICNVFVYSICVVLLCLVRETYQRTS